MPNLRTIVAATDFSDFSERVVQRAARVAKQHGSTMHLLHVVRPLELYPSLTLTQDEFSRHDEDFEEAERTRLRAIASGVADTFGVAVQTATRLGRAHTEIGAYADAVSADLVVIGARGENTLMDLFLGSTAARLMRGIHHPVLIVRRSATEAYARVLAAVDFSPLSAEVVAYALSLASGAEVEALHVQGSEVEHRLRRAKYEQVDIADWLARLRGEAERQLDTLLAPIENGASVTRRVEAGLPPAALCQYIDDHHVDLVVLGRHGDSAGLHEWLLGSVSRDVALAATSDVLMIGTSGKQGR
ncbi:MAG: universal stress protein [Thiobacillus sp.]